MIVYSEHRGYTYTVEWWVPGIAFVYVYYRDDVERKPISQQVRAAYDGIEWAREMIDYQIMRGLFQ